MTHGINADDNALLVMRLLDRARDTGDSATSASASDKYVDLA